MKTMKDKFEQLCKSINNYKKPHEGGFIYPYTCEFYIADFPPQKKTMLKISEGGDVFYKQTQIFFMDDKEEGIYEAYYNSLVNFMIGASLSWAKQTGELLK